MSSEIRNKFSLLQSDSHREGWELTYVLSLSSAGDSVQVLISVTTPKEN